MIFFFFFQAEDGIRDFHVTGVQTCALPICRPVSGAATVVSGGLATRGGPRRWTPAARRAPRTLPSGGDGPRLQVRSDLPLDALQGVVDRLGVARQPLAHLLVGVAVEVQREHAALELRQGARQASDQ